MLTKALDPTANRKQPVKLPLEPTCPFPRFPPSEAFGRRPAQPAAPSLIGPASETLHNSRNNRSMNGGPEIKGSALGLGSVSFSEPAEIRLPSQCSAAVATCRTGPPKADTESPHQRPDRERRQ